MASASSKIVLAVGITVAVLAIAGSLMFWLWGPGRYAWSGHRPAWRSGPGTTNNAPRPRKSRERHGPGSRSGMMDTSLNGRGTHSSIWPPLTDWDGYIPDSLPTPHSQEWLDRLQTVLNLERSAAAQYNADEQKYGIPTPYLTIISQADQQVTWLTELFHAYQLQPAQTPPPLVKTSTSVMQAYRIGQQLEGDLIPRYVWLVKHAGDNSSRQALNTMLLQTRVQQAMFEHVLELGN